MPPFVVDSELKMPDTCTSAYEFLCQFLDEQFFDNLLEKSKLYATRKGKLEDAALLTKDNLFTAIAIMHITGYSRPATRRLVFIQVFN